MIVYLNGQEALRSHVSDEHKSHADLTGVEHHEAAWDVWSIPNPSVYLRTGLNVIAVHAINVSDGSSDFVFDCELLDPGFSPYVDAAGPSPGSQNTVWSERAPPQVRQVSHEPQEPRAGEMIRVTAKISDPDQVQPVTLLYQAVASGQYIPAFLPGGW